MSVALLCSHAELWSAIAGAFGSLLLAVPYFVEWRHRRTREQRIRRRRQAGTGVPDRIAGGLISGSTDAVLAAGTKRALAAGIGAALLVVSFFLLIYFTTACH